MIKGKMMIERQVITTWHTPEEKAPTDGEIVVVTISGTCRDAVYDHCLETAEYYRGEGWYFQKKELNHNADLTVHAWADLEPYGGA